MNKITRDIDSSKKIAIFSHVSPDADALCSAFALKNIINSNFGIKFVDVFVDGEVGELYKPILRDETICQSPYGKYDLAIVLDSPNLDRIGKYKSLVESIPHVINIDHHETNEKFADDNYVSKFASSTAELIYLISKGSHYSIDDKIAKQLYQGIITDTNCFSSFAISKRTFQVVSELLAYDFDAEAIKEYYFKNNSKAKTILLSKALSSMKFYRGDKFITMKIPYELFSKIGASFEDTFGIIDNGINVSGTEVCAILIEKEPSKIYVSLRSKGLVNVGEIVKKYNGGGSQMLGAYQKDGNIKEVEQELVDDIAPLLPEEEAPEFTF